jgi:hypothetical protein
MFGTSKRSNTMIFVIAIDGSRKGCPGQIVHQLRKQSFASVHGESSGKFCPEGAVKGHLCSSRHHENRPKRIYDSYAYVEYSSS